MDAGVTWIIPSGLVLRVKTGAVTVNGHIVVATGPGVFRGNAYAPQGVAVAGAAGAAGGVAPTAFQASQILHPPTVGGGYGVSADDGYGGPGGGSLVIRSEGGITIGDGGSLSAPGGNGIQPSMGGGTGGGGGGVIILASKGSIVNNGLISAPGGRGSDGSSGYYGGGGGGGGIIHFLCPNATEVGGSVSVDGGTAGAPVGSPSGSSGFGGGASGGDGGNGTDTFFGVTTTDGADGLVLRTVVADPATLF